MEDNMSVVKGQSPQCLKSEVEIFGKIFHNPTLYDICISIAWASLYAPSTTPLNDSHPMWGEYIAYSEWFRLRICAQLGFSFDTKWDYIYCCVGILVEEEYPSREDFKKAEDFGRKHQLSDWLTPIIFSEFEDIKFKITKRI